MIGSGDVIGHVVGKYRLLDQLGEGGMGTVYRAEHVVLGSPAAVKVLLPQFTQDGVVVDRFFQEARAASAIRHPGIVEVFDFGRLPNGQAYIAMELLRGEDLSGFLSRRGPLDASLATQIAIQMLGALNATHAVGVIHRDLKPDNIMLLKRPGRRDLLRMAPDQSWITEREESYDFVKVLDFGIAKVLVQDELLAETVQGAVFGTPEYMSPEAARGEDVDHRADVYSLGVILFDMLCGRPPFEAPQSNEVLAMHIHNHPPSPREFAPHREITEMAESVILRAMQKDAGRRYQNMAEFRRDLANAYGSISYRRHGAPAPGLTPRGEEARTKKRLTEELDEWITGDASSLSLEQARMLSLVETAEKAFTPGNMSPQEAERLANALDRALEDDE